VEPTPIASEVSTSTVTSCRLTKATAKAPALAHNTEMLEGATRAISRDASEAVTQTSAAPVAEEENTLILDQQATVAEPDESATQLLPPPEETETETLALPPTPAENRITNETRRNTNEASRAQATASDDGLTRVGSILGTPLYMSPEQCRGEQLDARSDIYSLGVIAYQMLTGEPPFKGDLHEVMRQHTEAPPPPIREKRKKVPRRMAQIVMSALAKNLDERPASAATFASAFRASSEGTGKLLRRALALYSEHFPLFFRLGIMAYMPVFLISGIFLLKDSLPNLAPSGVVMKIIVTLLGIGLFFANFLASVVITGVTIWFVVQLYAAPLRPLRLRAALRSLKKRLKPFALTTMRVVVFSILLLPLLIVPGAIYFINASLTAPVVIIENLKGRAAVRRSKALVKHARLTVIAILVLQWAIPALMSSIVIRALGMNPKTETGVGFSLRFGEWIGTLLNVIFIPLVAMLTALLYLKVRQLSGERLKDMLDQFEQEEVPRSNWQKRMRERLSSSSHSTRSA
ncbi:MAG TPA: protein kinase, partial [Blastocatellia bacterium]|nr:protein kinase [Blastocatellia bacterium]